ncbi:MAG: hypothetical protein ABSF94_13030 [Steroidobacteraceae bacterium]|jgi:hypothetical protein
MKAAYLVATLLCCTYAWSLPSASLDSFERLKALAGEWDAELPGYGKITNTIRIVSNGTAIEETIGTPENNEVSLYTLDRARILLTHFCAMTADGHQVRLETADLEGKPGVLRFAFVGATNLHHLSAPHMRELVFNFIDEAHFSERWTKIENGKDTIFDLNFSRRSSAP